MKTGKLKLLIDKFDVENHWRNYGRIYFERFRKHNILQRIRYRQQEKELIRHLREVVFTDDNNISTVLEIGCGFGRITKLLLDNFNIRELEAFDLSSHQIENAKRYVTDNHAHFKVCNVFDYPFFPESFDLVIAVEVLMHIPPQRIEYAVQKMCVTTKKYVVSLDADYFSGKLAPHCFNHSYIGL